MTTPDLDSSLTPNDAWVLNSVFNPENALVQPKILINHKLPPSLPHVASDELQRLRAAELAAILPINSPRPELALVEKAISELTRIITAYPGYASAYSNRAQALSLLRVDGQIEDDLQFHTFWDDISQAIRLASPSTLNAEVSEVQGAVLASAYMQRANLLWQAAQKSSSSALPFQQRGAVEIEKLNWSDLQLLDRTELDELANRDFELAGRYGIDDARKMGMMTNPYGRLCGGIVQEAIRAEMGQSLAAADTGRVFV